MTRAKIALLAMLLLPALGLIASVPAHATCTSTTNGTVQTPSFLTGSEFQDGQSAGSITPACMRDLIASMMPLPYFVVSTTGSDSNPGTYAAPFLTLTKAQTMMRASATIKSVCLRTGTYVLSTAIALSTADNGETWMGCPVDVPRTAIIQAAATPPSTLFDDDSLSVSNMTWTNLVFDGGTAHGGGGGMIQLSTPTNIFINDNTFQNNVNSSDAVHMWCPTNISVRRNTSIASAGKFMAAIVNGACASTSYGHIFITDNTIVSNVTGVIPIELTAQAAPNFFFDTHIDRNTMTNTVATFPAISFIDNNVAPVTVGGAGNTVYGNVVYGTPGLNQVGIEIGVVNTTVAFNYFAGLDWGFEIGGGSTGVVIENNTIHLGNQSEFGADPGYTNSEWIGYNIVNNVVVTGWAGHTYGTRPAIYSPSALTP
jgi:hypothetical protein